MSLESKAKECELDIAELRSLREQATRTKVKDLLDIDLRKLETDLISLKNDIEKSETRLSKQTEEETAKKSSAAQPKIIETTIKNYSWDQSEKFVKLYLTNLKGIDQLSQDDIAIQYTKESVKVRILNLAGKTHLFNINKTCLQINPDKSYHKVKSDYLLVFLCKHNAGSTWSHITAAEKAAADAKKLGEPKMDDSTDPSAGLMNMMKKMYNEGDAEMKRTIAKAWTEGQEKQRGGAGGPELPGF